MNLHLITGHLGRDPEIKRLENSVIAKLSIATTENYRDKNGEWQKETEWHTVIAWGKLAESAERFQKGDLLSVRGKVSTRKWQDKDGNDRYTTETVAQQIIRLHKTGTVTKQVRPATTDTQPETSGPDDDLPF